LNIVTIEHADAVAHLDDILAVPGIDIAVVALFDLSMSLDFPGQRDHPEVRRLSAEAERKIVAAGVALGGVALSSDEAKAKIESGYRMLVLGYMC